MQVNEIPSIGTTLTYGEAIKAYDRFERTMLEKAYGVELCTTCSGSLSRSHRSSESRARGPFSRLKREIRSFASERTALANGVNGERFYLLQDESALRQHDETHLFRVGIDGDKLAGGLDEALELLSKESTKVDVYADTYSPNRSERDFDRLGEDPFMKWVGIGFCVMMICVGISMLVHSAFQIGFCSKWFI